MKRFFLKNKYKGIDDEFSDGDLIFGIAIIKKEIQLHLIKDRNCQYIIQAYLTNDVWSYADTRFAVKNTNDRSVGFLNHISMHDRYNVSALFISNTFKNRINVFKKTRKCGLEYQLLILKDRVHFLLMVLIYPLLPVKPMGTEGVLQQVSCDGCTDTVTCQMYERILSSGRTTKNYLRRMSFRCPCGSHIARKKFISRGIDRGGTETRKRKS